MKIKFAVEDNHAPKLEGLCGMRAMQHALLSVFHPSSSAPFISLECLGMSVINYSFLFSPTGARFKIAEYSQVITLTTTDLKTDCILCVLASGKQSKKK